MFLEFYGAECEHCLRMAPIVEKLEKEAGIKFEKYEIWHNQQNVAKLGEYDKDLCGGVPFFYNTENKKFICGETSYEELKKWALTKN